MDKLTANIRKWTILLGVIQITVGCIVGLIPPTAVQWYRGIVMAHIEFTATGVLMIVFGLIVGEMNLQARTLKAWFATLQAGTWLNGGAGVVAGFIGFSSIFLPTITEKFPPPNGNNHPLISTMLVVCGVMMLIALGLTIYGLLVKRQTNA